eukprot:1062795-Pelagomonas_calceolata.AAC.2
MVRDSPGRVTSLNLLSWHSSKPTLQLAQCSCDRVQGCLPCSWNLAGSSLPAMATAESGKEYSKTCLLQAYLEGAPLCGWRPQEGIHNHCSHILARHALLLCATSRAAACLWAPLLQVCKRVCVCVCACVPSKRNRFPGTQGLALMARGSVGLSEEKKSIRNEKGRQE